MDPKRQPRSLQLNRRTLLRTAILGAGGLAVVTTTGCSVFSSRGPISTVGTVDFKNPLLIPPLAPSSTEGSTRTFELRLQSGRSAIVPQGETDTWGVNGPILGPTLRAKTGEQVQVHLTNDLDEASTLHWHGMRLPASADGGPHQMVEPGETWSPTWQISQPAATLWYHPHPHGATEVHILRGIVGFFLLDDGEQAGLDLPSEYGVDDIPLVVQDRTFDDNGAFVETSRRDNGMLGDTVMVNATVGPILTVTAERTRLRLLNASAARSYNFGFADDRTFQMIASDGGLLPAPVDLERIMLSPGERAEIVVTMAAGEEAVIRSYPQDLGVTQRMTDRTGGSDELDVLQLRADAELTPSPSLPSALASVTPIDPAGAVATRPFALGDNRINNLAMDMARIDAQVTPDTVEVWEVRNVHTRPHNFHIHDVQFQILDLDGEPPPAHLAGWKDTIFTAPGVLMRLVMKFGENPDPEVPYMFHCHMLWHEDQGMMGQFVVSNERVLAPLNHGAGHQH